MVSAVTEGVVKVNDVVHSPAEWVSAEPPVSEGAARMASADIGAIPVGHKGRLVGMITDRDLVLPVVGQKQAPETTRTNEVITPSIVCYRTAKDVEDAIPLRDHKKIRRLPVFGDKKRPVGTLSLGDVAQGTGLRLAGELARTASSA